MFVWARPASVPVNPLPDLQRRRSSSSSSSSSSPPRRPPSSRQQQQHQQHHASVFSSQSRPARSVQAASPSAVITSSSSSPHLLERSATTPQSMHSTPSPPHSSQEALLLSSSFSLSSSVAAASTSTTRSASPSLSPSAPPRSVESSFTYHHFSQRMKDPAASGLVRRLKAFVRHCNALPLPSTAAALSAAASEVQAFVSSLSSSLPRHPLFVSASAAELYNAAESMEKFVLSKAHLRWYGRVDEDEQRNARLAARCRQLRWLRARHLELPSSPLLPPPQAQEELRRMGEYKAPKDKLVCLLNAAHLVSAALQAVQDEVGADDIFPAFILTLIHAQCPTFIHDMRWVGLGRRGAQTTAGDGSEVEYWLVMAESAVVFIEQMTESSIRLEAEGEWEREMEKARLREEEERTSSRKAVYLRLHDTPRAGREIAPEEEKRIEEERDGKEGGKAGYRHLRAEEETDSEQDGLSSANVSSSSSSSSGLSRTSSRSRPPASLNIGGEDSNASGSSFSFQSTPSTSPASSPLSSLSSPLSSPVLLPIAGPPLLSLSVASSPSSSPPGAASASLLQTGLSLHYLHARPEDLSMNDLPRLLDEYRLMADCLRHKG